MKIVNSKNIGDVSGAQVSPDHTSKILKFLIFLIFNIKI